MMRLTEYLSSADPIENWIADFVKSDDLKFKDKSKKDRIRMALGAFYASREKNESASDKRLLKIVSLAVNSNDEDMMKFFIESNMNISDKSILAIRDKWEDFCLSLNELTIDAGATSKIKCAVPINRCEYIEV